MQSAVFEIIRYVCVAFIGTLQRIARLLGSKIPWMEHEMFQVVDLFVNVNG
jgi:hypothetical protein